MNRREVEILIIGAGTSGVAAAIVALRRGRSVLLVEPSPWIGGMLTAAGVSAIDGNHTLASGLWDEFRDRLRNYYGGPEALETGWISRTLFEPEVGERILREMLAEAAQDHIDHVLVLNQQLHHVYRDGARLRGAAFGPTHATVHHSQDTEITFEVYAEIVIAADEYGDTVHACGLTTHYGFEGRSVTGESYGPWNPYAMPQDLTYVATVGPIDLSAVGGSEPLPSFPHILDGGRLDWRDFFQYATLPNGRFMLNWPIRGNDYSGDYLTVTADRSSRARIFAHAKTKTRKLLRELRERFPDARLTTEHALYPTEDSLPPIPYIREARRLYGARFLTADALTHPFGPAHQSLLNEAVAVGNYPLDHHRKEDLTAPEVAFPEIPAFSIPLGVMITHELENLIVAEKSISVSGVVNGATRLQPVTLLLGQAAGIAACAALETGGDFQSVPVRQVQARLLTDNAMLMPYTDAPPQDPDFLPLQWAGVLGHMWGTPQSIHWENQMLIRPKDPAHPDEIDDPTLITHRVEAPATLLKRARHVEAAHLIAHLGTEEILGRLRRSQTGTILRRDAALRAVLSAGTKPPDEERIHI